MSLRSVVSSTLLVLALAPSVARAQSGGDYDLSRSQHAGGGLIPVTGGSYALSGTIGQADAGELAGGDFALSGGFWGRISTSPTDVGPLPDAIPRVFASRLAGANPFRGTIALAYDLPAPRQVSLAVYGVDGRVVRRFPAVERNAGRHLVAWDGRDDAGRGIAPGVYFLSLKAGESSATHRIVRLD